MSHIHNLGFVEYFMMETKNFLIPVVIRAGRSHGVASMVSLSPDISVRIINSYD